MPRQISIKKPRLNPGIDSSKLAELASASFVFHDKVCRWVYLITQGVRESMTNHHCKNCDGTRYCCENFEEVPVTEYPSPVLH